MLVYKTEEKKAPEANPEQKEQDRPTQKEQTTPEGKLLQKEQDRPAQEGTTGEQPRKKRNIQKPPSKSRKVRFKVWFRLFLARLLYRFYSSRIRVLGCGPWSDDQGQRDHHQVGIAHWPTYARCPQADGTGIPTFVGSGVNPTSTDRLFHSCIWGQRIFSRRFVIFIIVYCYCLCYCMCTYLIQSRLYRAPKPQAAIQFLVPFACITHSAIQILFVPERPHGIATAYRGREVLLYDSCFSGTLSPTSEEQLYSAVVSVCKLLMECLECKELPLFPTTSAVTTRCPKKHVLLHVYCVCRLPESYDSNMIECDKCGSWFHFKRMGLWKNALTDSWFCTHWS